MKNKISRFSALILCVATVLVSLNAQPSIADSSIGKIVVSGDEWAFSDAGMPSAYVTNVLQWFGLVPGGSGKKVLILDGQSWNSGYGGTSGAFGSIFRSFLASHGIAVTYLGYQDEPVTLTGYDAVFVDGFIIKATTLPADLAAFVGAGGAVYLAGGTGTFNDPTPAGEAAFWQPFFTAVTGSADFGLIGGGAWSGVDGSLHGAGPVGDGANTLPWYMGQGVQIGNNPNASAAIWDSSHTLVAIWSAQPKLVIRRLPANTVNMSWPSPSTGWTLQQCDNLAAGNWSVSSLTVSDNGTNKSVSTSSPEGSLFFRLAK
jgi:hypothetical protein